MRYFSYRNKMRLRSLTVTIIVIAIALLALVAGIFLYFQRFIVYTPTGAYLDMNTPQSPAENPLNPTFTVEPPAPPHDADLVVDQPTEENEDAAPAPLSGYYITADMLAAPDALLAALTETDTSIAVLMDVKSIYGNFYYTSTLPDAEASNAVDTARVDQLIATLSLRKDVYLIARLPAFRDSTYALDNQSGGLPLTSGALWMDASSCYWLDPANDQVVSYLESIAMELQALGFDEVVFSDFYFPNSGNIAYPGDRDAAILEAARRLSTNLSGNGLPVSFFSTTATLAPYAQRLYVENADGAEVLEIANGLTQAYPSLPAHLVFLTDSHDTRFSQYSVLSPAVSAEAP